MVQRAVLRQILPPTIRPTISNSPSTPVLTPTLRCLDFLKQLRPDFAGEIPLILKLNAHDLLHEEKDPLGAQTASVSDALRLGCVAIGYTIYPGTAERRLQYEQLRELASEAKAAGLVVVVWTYPRGGGLSKEGETALDVIAYGAQIAAQLGAHIIKSKCPLRIWNYPRPRKFTKSKTFRAPPRRSAFVMSCKALLTDGALSSSPADQRKMMKPYSPRVARSATAADSARSSGAILSSGTKRPLWTSSIRWFVFTRAQLESLGGRKCKTS